MELLIKQLIGSFGVFITIISYIPYIYHILKGKTKPHAFSWFVWSILVGIAFFVQILDGAGPGAWITGVTAVLTFVIFLFALKVDVKFTKLDWYSLAAAIITLIIWYFTNNALLALILVIMIDIFGYVPTFRKGFHFPFEETAFTFGISVLKNILALLALENYLITTWLFPTYLVIANGAFVALLMSRRKILSKI